MLFHMLTFCVTIMFRVMSRRKRKEKKSFVLLSSVRYVYMLDHIRQNILYPFDLLPTYVCRHDGKTKFTCALLIFNLETATAYRSISIYNMNKREIELR